MHATAFLFDRYDPMHTEARAREHTVHETGDPRVSDPNHGAGNDTGEVGALSDAIGIV